MVINRAAIVLLGLSCGLIFLGQDIRVGIRIRAFDLGLLLIVVLFVWDAVRRGVRSGSVPFLLALGAFAVYIACNAALQVSTTTAVKEFAQLCFFAVFFLALVQYLDTPENTRTFLMVLVATLWVLALWNAWAHVSRGVLAGWKELGDQKMTHSVLLTIMLTISLSSLRPRGLAWALLLTLAIVLLFLSGERKGWVAAFLAVFGAFLISEEGGIGRRSLTRTMMIACAIAALIAAIIPIAPYVPYLEKQLVSSVDFIRLLFADETTRQAADTTASNEGRLAMIQFGLHHLRENPVFGIGPEQFRRVTSAMAFLPISSDDVKGVHNELLRIGAELGYVGLGFYALVNLTIAGRAMMLIRVMGKLDDSERLRVRLGVALFLYGFAVNVFLAGGGLNTFFYVMPAGILFSVPLPQRHLALARARRDPILPSLPVDRATVQPR